ncbi:hypothetical protein F5Y00DRAFT_268164 [Daldinia vernicosa]|uniref:uncharacterized protein n=1 Tax=Daldinia vernicosa TaxID=114800 RepID=UPI00200861B4|nr:uncharacterized protein F5Y00DRAFT_268164 [Daldinia vernicosa]KAI0850752.1 hypothetical protein F5Y00DRAFT_268164 [Daldinia vernicosa]
MPHHGQYLYGYIADVTYRCWWDHRRTCWGRFIIPDTLLEPSSTSQSSALVRLPPELLLSIFKDLDPFGKVCLALACKNLLRVSCLVNIQLPSAIKHRQLCLPSCAAMRYLLNLVHPVKPGGKPSRAVAICYYCYRYQPTTKSHWKHERGKFLSGHPILSLVDEGIESWGDHSSTQCPGCLTKELLNKENSYAKESNGKVKVEK